MLHIQYMKLTVSRRSPCNIKIKVMQCIVNILIVMSSTVSFSITPDRFPKHKGN